MMKLECCRKGTSWHT